VQSDQVPTGGTMAEVNSSLRDAAAPLSWGR